MAYVPEDFNRKWVTSQFSIEIFVNLNVFSKISNLYWFLPQTRKDLPVVL